MTKITFLAVQIKENLEVIFDIIVPCNKFIVLSKVNFVIFGFYDNNQCCVIRDEDCWIQIIKDIVRRGKGRQIA